MNLGNPQYTTVKSTCIATGRYSYEPTAAKFLERILNDIESLSGHEETP